MIQTSPWLTMPHNANGGERTIFVLTDIHGRLDLLDKAIAHITTIGQGKEFDIVIMGDFIDFGPQGFACLKRVETIKEKTGANAVHFLPGNHELMLLDVLKNHDDLRFWTINMGGEVMIQEAENILGRTLGRYSDILNGLDSLLPSFLNKPLTHAHRAGNLLFVHAGVDPNRNIEKFLQIPASRARMHAADRGHWAWIRTAFLNHEAGWDHQTALIVHGHSPFTYDDVQVVNDILAASFCPKGNRRINLDCGTRYATAQSLIGEFKGSKMRYHLIGA